MKDILNFIRDSIETSKERLKSPILIYYLLFLIFIHWKAISIYLFSTEPIEKRISKIERLYRYWSQGDFFWQALLMLFFVVLINITLPFIMWLFDEIQIVPNRKRKTLLYKNNAMERIEELEKTKHEFNKSKIISGNVETEDFNTRIETLQNTIEENRKSHQKEVNLIKSTYEDQLKSIQDTYSRSLKNDGNLINNLNTIQYQDYPQIGSLINQINKFEDNKRNAVLHILKNIVENEGISNFNTKFIETQFEIFNMLKNNNAIIEIRDNRGNPNYFSTIVGRSVLHLIQKESKTN